MEINPQTSMNTPLSQRILQTMRHDVPFQEKQDTQIQKRAGDIARWSTVALFVLLPFFFIPTAWSSIAHAKMLLVAVLVIAATLLWVASVLSEGVVRLPKSLLLLAALLVPVAYITSAIATGASWVSFVGGGVQQDTVVTVLIWYALFVACANVLSMNMQRLVSVARALTLGGAVVLLIQIFRLAFPSFTFGDSLIGQAASVIGSWHDLGIFLGLIFFLSLAFLPTPIAQSGRWKLLFRAVAVFAFLFLVIINFSDVWLALLGLSTAYAVFLWYVSRTSPETTPRATGRRVFWWGAVALATLGLYFGGNIIHGILPSALQVTQLEVRPSWQGTYAVGSGALSQPGSIFFGSGPNTFPREWGIYKPLSVNATQFWNIDFYSGVGFIPTSFVTVGLLGALAWSAVCLAVLLSVWRVIRARRSDNDGIIHAVFVASALYLTVFHVLYVPGPVLSALLFMLFGAVVAAELLTGSIKDWTFRPSLDTWKGRASVAVLAIFGIVVLFGSVQLLRALSSDLFVNRSVAIYNETEDFARASRQTEIALAILPQNDRAHRAAVELGLLQFTGLVSQGNADEAARTELQNTLTKTIQHGLQAVAIESTSYQNWLLLARLYGDLAGAGVEGAEEQARVAYEEARKKSPTNPLPLLGLAQLDLLGGGDASAREHLASALEIKPDFAAALFLLSQIEARAGNLEVALEKAAAVVQIVPNDALGWYNAGTILYAQKDFANAAVAFERAVGLQNDYANALFLLSASYAELKRFPDALTTLRAVAALNPSQETVQSMIKDLEAGKNPFTAL